MATKPLEDLNGSSQTPEPWPWHVSYQIWLPAPNPLSTSRDPNLNTTRPESKGQDPLHMSRYVQSQRRTTLTPAACKNECPAWEAELVNPEPIKAWTMRSWLDSVPLLGSTPSLNPRRTVRHDSQKRTRRFGFNSSRCHF